KYYLSSGAKFACEVQELEDPTGYLTDGLYSAQRTNVSARLHDTVGLYASVCAGVASIQQAFELGLIKRYPPAYPAARVSAPLISLYHTAALQQPKGCISTTRVPAIGQAASCIRPTRIWNRGVCDSPKGASRTKQRRRSRTSLTHIFDCSY